MWLFSTHFLLAAFKALVSIVTKSNQYQWLGSPSSKGLSKKIITSLKTGLFTEALNGFARTAQVGSEPVNPWTDNSFNDSIG